MKAEGTEKMLSTNSEDMKDFSNKEKGMEKIKSYFSEEFSDEMKGCNEYADLAHQAKEAGDTTLAYGLYQMAKDEYTHAKFIHDYLIEWGCEIPEMEVSKYHQTKERISHIFR